MLAAGGPDAVRIESLARALGVSKGGFYGYFEDRRALLDEMLDTCDPRSTEDVIDRVEHEGGDAMTRARRAADHGTRSRADVREVIRRRLFAK